ncbi:receptor expression-enhancing protein 6 isoform 2-T2 [Morphnus guianensis]
MAELGGTKRGGLCPVSRAGMVAVVGPQSSAELPEVLMPAASSGLGKLPLDQAGGDRSSSAAAPSLPHFWGAASLSPCPAPPSSSSGASLLPTVPVPGVVHGSRVLERVAGALPERYPALLPQAPPDGGQRAWQPQHQSPGRGFQRHTRSLRSSHEPGAGSGEEQVRAAAGATGTTTAGLGSLPRPMPHRCCPQ